MNTTWILVAHRSGAKLFEKQGKELNLLREISHEAGRLQDHELSADRPGRVFDRQGAGRHAVGGENKDAVERETKRFVRELGDVLEEGRVHRRYANLVLVAEPRFLGELRAAVTPETQALISATRSRDLAPMESSAVKDYLQDVTWPPPRKPRH
jgi:protein required for attachment to host cells